MSKKMMSMLLTLRFIFFGLGEFELSMYGSCLLCGTLKQDALSPLLFNCGLEYAIRKVQEDQVGLKLNGTHQLLAYADNVNLPGDNVDTRKKNTEYLIGASKEVGLEINVEKTKYMLLSCHQNARKNHDIKTVNTWIENMAQFKYFGGSVTNQNLIQEEIKRR
jgi:hypothetical protein